MSETLQKRKITLVNPELFSGSADPLRTELNQGWLSTVTDDGTEVVELPASEPTLPSYLEAIYINTDHTEVVSSSALIKSWKVPVRLEGHASNIASDEMWTAFIWGGSESYPDSTADSEDLVEYSFGGVVREDVYSDSFFTYHGAYENKMAKVLNSQTGDSYASFTIKPYYNYHIPEYYFYEQATPLQTERELINIHWYESTKDAEGEDNLSLMPLYVQNFITRENSLEQLQDINSDTPINTLLSKVYHQMLPPEESLHLGVDIDGDSSDDYMSDRNYNLRRYLSSSYVNGPVSGSTRGQYEEANYSLIYNAQTAVDLLSSNSTILQNRDIYPQYIEIVIPGVNTEFVCTAADGSLIEEGDDRVIRNIITDEEYDSVFMYNLIQYFNPAVNPQDALISTAREFIKIEEYVSGSQDSDSQESKYTAFPVNYKTLDWISFLTRVYNNGVNPETAGTDETPSSPINTKMTSPVFMGQQTTAVTTATLGQSNASIYINSGKTLNVLKDSLDFISSNAFQPGSIGELYKVASESKYYETLAYRIEKTINGGIVQNYWIFNSVDLDDINFTDSQVKYGITYEYNIFRYIVAKDLKYRFTDPIYTQQIAVDTTDDEEVVSYCLQFLDSGNNPTAQLFDPEDESLDISAVNTFADVTQVIKSPVPYYADMMMEYETSLRLFEVPFGKKVVTLQDHPPSALDIIPFYIKNDSNIIGFQINYEAFAKIKMPIPLSVENKIYRSSYMHSYDMLDTDKVVYSSRSRLNQIEVYRIDTLPKKYEDFGFLPHKTYDMPIKNEKSSYGVVNCYDKIRSNKKYYYLFRALNDAEVHGPLSEIYEVELVNDGGYNYLITKIIHENELDPTNYTNPTTRFKKLLSLRPAAGQAVLNTTNVDYSQPSNTQLDNVTLGSEGLEDPVWGKTFKLRLKSKKTGKKIDLNITYNLENG